jgi:dissimilatory sulfite reductase (desulfoviridin) alpha/beta subunit
MGVSDLNWIAEASSIPQKQPGYARIHISIPAGDLPASLVPSLRQIAENYGRGEFRCTRRHELEIPFIREPEVQNVLSALDRLGIRTTAEGPRPNVVACPGTDHCPVAYAKTKSLCFEIRSFLLKAQKPGALPPDFQVAISGCPNECSQVMINDVGFVGAIGSYGGQKAQGFELTVGGTLRGEGRLGTRIAFVSQEDVIPTLRDVLEIYRQRAASGATFHEFFFETGPEEFSALLLEMLKHRMWFFAI